MVVPSIDICPAVATIERGRRLATLYRILSSSATLIACLRLQGVPRKWPKSKTRVQSYGDGQDCERSRERE